MSIVPAVLVDPRRVAAGAASAGEEAQTEATFGMALMMAVAAQQPPRPEAAAPLPVLALDAALIGEDAAAEPVATPAAEGSAAAAPDGGLARAARTLAGATAVIAGGAARLVAGADATPALDPALDPALAGAAQDPLSATAATTGGPRVSPIRLPGVPEPAGRVVHGAPVIEPVPAPLVSRSDAVPTANATVLAASAGPPAGAVAAGAPPSVAVAVAAEPPAATLETPAAARAAAAAAVATPRAGSEAAANPGEGGTREGGERAKRELPDAAIASGTPAAPAERPAVPVMPLAAPRTPEAANAAAAVRAGVSDMPAAVVEQPPATPLSTPGRVTLHFEGEGGLEGRLRVALRGPDLHATIVSAPEALPALEGGLGDLRRALMDRGFPNVHLAVHAAPPAEADASASGRRSESGSEGRSEPRSRREDEAMPREQRPRGRDSRRSPEK